ncbi:galactosylxylosylprotein 3-beta-galactosyltransferase [Sarracenia purpurea var. burkii]
MPIIMLKRQLALATLPSLAILLCIFFILFTIRQKSPLLSSSNTVVAKREETLRLHSRFKLLIGILTRPDKYDHRHFLRLIYGVQSSPDVGDIDVKFVFCNLTKPEQRVLVALEIMRFDDVIILDCSENMNGGKTYTYDYIMKVDDDVFLRLAPLALSLEVLPRLDLYYGFVIPCASTNPFVGYMSGMGFALSWDLVEWISGSEIPKNETYGPEDKLVGKWLNMGKKAKNRFSNKPAMYDYPGTNGRCSHDLIPETVAVHRLKRWDQWLHVLNFFNVTKQLRHSKLYSV